MASNNATQDSPNVEPTQQLPRTSTLPATTEHPSTNRVRYRTDYRDYSTNGLIESSVTDEPQLNNVAAHDTSPAFDVVVSHRVKLSTTNIKDYEVVAHIAPTRHIEIHSVAIINALQSVVEYYPQQDLSLDLIKIECPYPILVHHYDELVRFRDECQVKDPLELCFREENAFEHLRLLLNFLDNEVMAEVNAEKERNRRGYNTFEWMWVMQRPGETVLETTIDDHQWKAFVIHSIYGGSFTNPPTPWTIFQWGLCFDGHYLGRYMMEKIIDKSDGESYYLHSTRIINQDIDMEDPAVRSLVKSGTLYWKLLKKACRYYKGPMKTFPYNQVDGLVMTDVVSYYQHFQSSTSQGAPVRDGRIVHSDTSPPKLMDDSDLRKWISDCTCPVCRGRTEANDRKTEAKFEDYNNITLLAWDELEDEQYLLCPLDVPAFVFRTRAWEIVEVAKLQEPRFEENMIDNLVMDPRRVQILKSLSKSYARLNHNGAEMEREQWAADFVKGKGNGLIFLLHGTPGVGKTCTAECIAEFTKRPLMVLTNSDIGMHPAEVEGNLTKHFKTAKSWGAVLLIDEADVFMDRRSTTDLIRNSLVAAFLRALEFYDGILFLTTNRVGSFDDAFISRVHIQLYYPPLTDEQRTLVWKTFTKKLANERGDYIRLNLDAKEYLDGSQVRTLKLNGREIRNAFQTAVSLAEYDAQRDEEGRILLTDEHLKAVVELSKDFKGYLDELHRGDEAKRAERTYERLDTFRKEKKDT